MKTELDSQRKIRRASKNWIEYFQRGGKLSVDEYIKMNKQDKRRV